MRLWPTPWTTSKPQPLGSSKGERSTSPEPTRAAIDIRSSQPVTPKQSNNSGPVVPGPMTQALLARLQNTVGVVNPTTPRAPPSPVASFPSAPVISPAPDSPSSALPPVATTEAAVVTVLQSPPAPQVVAAEEAAVAPVVPIAAKAAKAKKPKVDVATEEYEIPADEELTPAVAADEQPAAREASFNPAAPQQPERPATPPAVIAAIASTVPAIAAPPAAPMEVSSSATSQASTPRFSASLTPTKRRQTPTIFLPTPPVAQVPAEASPAAESPALTAVPPPSPGTAGTLQRSSSSSSLKSQASGGVPTTPLGRSGSSTPKKVVFSDEVPDAKLLEQQEPNPAERILQKQPSSILKRDPSGVLAAALIEITPVEDAITARVELPPRPRSSSSSRSHRSSSAGGGKSSSSSHHRSSSSSARRSANSSVCSSPAHSVRESPRYGDANGSSSSDLRAPGTPSPTGSTYDAATPRSEPSSTPRYHHSSSHHHGDGSRSAAAQARDELAHALARLERKVGKVYQATIAQLEEQVVSVTSQLSELEERETTVAARETAALSEVEAWKAKHSESVRAHTEALSWKAKYEEAEALRISGAQATQALTILAKQQQQQIKWLQGERSALRTLYAASSAKAARLEMETVERRSIVA